MSQLTLVGSINGIECKLVATNCVFTSCLVFEDIFCFSGIFSGVLSELLFCSFVSIIRVVFVDSATSSVLFFSFSELDCVLLLCFLIEVLMLSGRSIDIVL